MRIYLFIYLFIYLLSGCKQTSDNKESKTNISVKKEIDSCIQESDSLEINNFIKQFINEIDNDKKDLFSSKFHYPFHLFDVTIESQNHFINEWLNDERIKNYLTLEEYDEYDNYLGKGTFQRNNIFYIKENKSNECNYVQYFIGNKIFIIKKIKKDLKIVQIDGVG